DVLNQEDNAPASSLPARSFRKAVFKKVIECNAPAMKIGRLDPRVKVANLSKLLVQGSESVSISVHLWLNRSPSVSSAISCSSRESPRLQFGRERILRNTLVPGGRPQIVSLMPFRKLLLKTDRANQL